jgi:hypothetical protein
MADQKAGHKKRDIGADHENVAVGKVDQAQHPVDQGVPQGDESVEASPLQGV